MSFETRACVTLVCDAGCDDAFGDEGGIPHFDSELEAFEYGQQYDWHFEDGQALCPRCHEKRECVRLGHDWDEWCDWSRDGIDYQRRSCERCGISGYDPPFEQLYPKLQALRDAEQVLQQAAREIGGGR